MSTEYSVKMNVCPHCNRAEKEINIGVCVSHGFIAHYPCYHANVSELLCFLRGLSANDKIFNEYEEEKTLQEMIEIIKGKK